MSYEQIRKSRFGKLAAKVDAQVQARKYVRLDTIKEGSGDAAMEETVYDARAFGNKRIRSMKRVLTSESGMFWPLDVRIRERTEDRMGMARSSRWVEEDGRESLLSSAS